MRFWVIILLLLVFAVVPCYAYFGGFPFGDPKFNDEQFGTGLFGVTSGSTAQSGDTRVTPEGDTRVTDAADTRVIP